jgi:hypothetical protein
LVFCGRLDVEKGVPLLLRAFARTLSFVPEAALRIIGRGPLQPACEQLVAELHLASAVTFTGWLEPPQIDAHLAEAWALVAPSVWAEPLGLVAIEAIVRGVPVIASRSGGLSEVVEDGRSGLLFSNGDETALTECMLAIAQRRAFPAHTLTPHVVLQARKRHALDTHVEKLRQALVEVSSSVSGN